MKTVFCKKYQKDLEALDRAPLPGKKGQEILSTVSKQAWADWQAHQTRLINEKHLNLMEKEARDYLQSQMQLFFDNKDFDQADGYKEQS